MLRNHVVDFVEICNACVRKVIIEAVKRIINSDKVCHSYSDLNFGVTFLEHSVLASIRKLLRMFRFRINIRIASNMASQSRSLQ